MPSPRFVQRFHRLTQDAPLAPALAWRGQTFTYRDLLTLVQESRAGLEELRDGRPVCVSGHKSPFVVALLIACWEQGRPVLVPPADYAASVVDDLASRTGCGHVGALSPQDVAEVRWRELHPGSRAGTSPHRTDTFLMLTTSGSTGTPKVVLTSTIAVDAFIDWAQRRFSLSNSTVALNYAPLNFDLCLLDVWATLSVGGSAVLATPMETVSARPLSALIADQKVTLVQAVPLCFRTLADASSGPFPTVQDVLITGEAAGPAVARALPTLFPSADFANIYGCTETNDSFIHRATADELRRGTALPIGHPLPGVRARLVDENGQTVHGAGRGRLLVSSPYQAHGYLDPALTEERFLSAPDIDRIDGPLPATAGRYFRSGDVARRDEQGTCWLEGRDDHQVKVRGVRTSTTSVEDVLRSCPAVGDAAVIAVPHDLEGHTLHAVVETAAGPQRARLTTLTLRRVCAERLPAAVVPSSFAIADGPLPRTATGKIDRRSVERSLLQKGRL